MLRDGRPFLWLVAAVGSVGASPQVTLTMQQQQVLAAQRARQMVQLHKATTASTGKPPTFLQKST